MLPPSAPGSARSRARSTTFTGRPRSVTTRHAGSTSVNRTSARVSPVRTTVRPYPADTFTCAGAMPDIDGYYMAVTHSGVTIAPYLGRVVADEAVRGLHHQDMETFRPHRFFQKAAEPASA